MSLTVDLNGRGTGFKAMLDTARTQAKAFSHSVTHEVGESWGGIGKTLASSISGIFAVEGVKRTLEWFIDTGKEIRETAEQVDMSTDSWQKWSEAVDKAGLSTVGFQRIVETLREKRTAALTDPKARGELSRLGFSDADITNENLDMGEFTRRALANANGGDWQRKFLSDVIGQRALKFATALPNLATAQALFSENDLKKAADAANKLKEVEKVASKIKIEAVNTVFADNDNPGATYISRMMERVMRLLGVKSLAGRAPDFSIDPRLPDHVTYKGTGAGGEWESPPGEEHKEHILPTEHRVADPMDAVLAQQKIDLEQHEQERQQRLLDSSLGLMTIGSRRAAILADAEKLRQQIGEREAAARGNIFLTQAQQDSLAGMSGKALELKMNEYRSKFVDETTEKKIRLNKDQGELRENPMTFKADTMQGVGLYQASALAFNPVLGVMEKQTQILERIARNTDHSGNDRHHLEP